MALSDSPIFKRYDTRARVFFKATPRVIAAVCYFIFSMIFIGNAVESASAVNIMAGHARFGSLDECE
jgi:hypothetical protein